MLRRKGRNLSRADRGSKRPVPVGWQATRVAMGVEAPVKHVSFRDMKVMTVRDIRQRWPEAERALHEHDEVIVTRDGRPVARILRPEPAPIRPRVDWSALHRRRPSLWR